MERKYIEKIKDEQRELLKNLTGKKLNSLTAPQIIFEPLSQEKTYIFPWLSLHLEAENDKQYLNISVERLETESYCDYHRFHIFLADKPACSNRSSFYEFSYNENFPSVLMDIHEDITDVEIFCRSIETEETKEQIQAECDIIITLNNGSQLHLYPHFCGEMVTTGMISASITQK